jgi:hypothetical protein
MSETQSLTEEETAQAPPAPLPPSPPAQPPLPKPAAVLPAAQPRWARPLWPVFLVFFIGFAVLAAGELYLWTLDQAKPDDATQLAVLQAEVTDLRTMAAKAPAAAPVQDNVTVEALAAQVNAVQAQVANDHGALSTLQANNTDLTKLSARIELLNQLESARMALEAGQALGNIPNAPPALAQFATAAPPTLAALRENFPAAAQAAEQASISGDAKSSYWSRVLARLEGFITVTEGTHVVLGAPAAGVLDKAQNLLDAGDLSGAVAQLETLSAPPQTAMAGWLGQAKALLAAQAALIALAGQD